MGTHVPKPNVTAAIQFELNTIVSFAAPGFACTVRVQKETAPGSGVWGSTTSGLAFAGTTNITVPGYTQNASYRIRFERQGVPSPWTFFLTPTAALGFPAPVTSLEIVFDGLFIDSGSVHPSEPNTLVRWQFLNAGVPIEEATVLSNGVLSTMGPYVCSFANATSFRARHERFSGTGSWASGWVEVP